MKLIRIPEATFKVTQLAQLWDCTPRYLKNQIQRGNLEGVLHGRDWYVTVASANRFFEARRVRS